MTALITPYEATAYFPRHIGLPKSPSSHSPAETSMSCCQPSGRAPVGRRCCAQRVGAISQRTALFVCLPQLFSPASVGSLTFHFLCTSSIGGSNLSRSPDARNCRIRKASAHLRLAQSCMLLWLSSTSWSARTATVDAWSFRARSSSTSNYVSGTFDLETGLPRNRRRPYVLRLRSRVRNVVGAYVSALKMTWSPGRADPSLSLMLDTVKVY